MRYSGAGARSAGVCTRVEAPARAAGVTWHARGPQEHEVATMRELHHENIVAYYGTERTREVLNIFMEYVPGGSLRQVCAA